MQKTIQKGSKCNAVKIAKYLTGYSENGKANTSFDVAFRRFVVSWQCAHGLTADGVIGPSTWVKIADNAPVLGTKTKAAIRAFQLATGLSENGAYSSAVKNLIIAYQKAAGINADGVCGPTTWREVIALYPVAHHHTVNYKQNDRRWSNVVYSRTGKKTGQTIGNSGCGPTSFASIVALEHPSITPVEMCALAVSLGDRRASGGTDGAFFKHASAKYGYRCLETRNVSLFKHCLDSGGYVVCAFKPKSWWTSCGHYSPAWKYDGSYFYVDNTISSIKVKRPIAKLSGDCRSFYLIYPK